MLDQLRFDNQFVSTLPADPESQNFIRQVLNASYSLVTPTPVSAPSLVSYSHEVASELDLSIDDCESERFVQVFSGNELLPGMQPYAMRYGGHQFGNWAGQLGDGRAINLGEVINKAGRRWTLQLKGAGVTPYSRSADGLAVLRSSVREFLCSEAMYHLGVPTTRALSLLTTGEQVPRDMFYNGETALEPGAVVCRVAPSFIRFGNFEILAAQGETDLLKQLADHTIKTDFPGLDMKADDLYITWFRDICQRTAELMVHWMRVGFVHGVMNTDNLSILGLTIDYGPYGWLDNYDPEWTPNTTDAQGRRYRYEQQPAVALWNLHKLANAIYPLINDAEPLQDALQFYQDQYEAGRQQMVANKLGLARFEEETDRTLTDELFSIMTVVETDMTLFFRALADIDIMDMQDMDKVIALLKPAYYQDSELPAEYVERLRVWFVQYKERLAVDNMPHAERREAMNLVNPKYVLRNYLAQQAIELAEKGDHRLVNELLDVMRNPYTEQEGKEAFSQKRPEWARHKAGCSMLSCSS